MAEFPRSPTGETDYSAMVEALRPQQQREMMGLVSALAKYLAPEYLQDPSRTEWQKGRDAPLPEQGKVPTNQPASLGEQAPQIAFDLATMGAGGAAKAAIPLLGGVAAKLAPSAERTGIRAFHGSPYDFDKFSLGKIGTGEGAQAYGHGLYFAENEGTARTYRDALAKPSIFDDENRSRAWNRLRGQLTKEGFDTHQAQSLVNDFAAHFQAGGKSGAIDPSMWPAEYQKIAAAASRHLGPRFDELYRPASGRMYEVNINAHPDQFLDWDKPLGQHSQYVQDKIAQARGVSASQFAHEVPSTHLALRSPEQTQEWAQAGIPGIKYLDQGSRMTGGVDKLGDNYFVKGSMTPYKTRAEAEAAEDALGNTTRNYVVFNDQLIDILRKYGIAAGILPAVGANGNNTVSNQ